MALSTRSHAGESRRRTDFDQTLELVLREEEVLRLNPANGRSGLVSEEFDEDGVCELLALLESAPTFFVLVLQHRGETGRRSLVVNELGVVLSDREGLSDQVRNVFALQHIGVEVSGLDLLRKV